MSPTAPILQTALSNRDKFCYANATVMAMLWQLGASGHAVLPAHTGRRHTLQHLCFGLQVASRMELSSSRSHSR